MLNRRRFTTLMAATALGALAAPALIRLGFAQGAAAPVARGNYLIRNGAVITVDPALGVVPRGDVHVRNGRIEAIAPDLQAADADVIDATDMIVMLGFIDTHYHMWSALGRGGKLVAYDVDKIVREAKASAMRIRTAAGGRLAPAGGR